MKGFRLFLLNIFSICILGLAVLGILTAINVISLSTIETTVNSLFKYNREMSICILGLISILSIIALFAGSSKEEDVRTGIAIKHETGTVYISKDTFESIILNVTKMYASFKNVKVSVTISESGVIANIYAYILPDTVVPTLTSKLQENIKDSLLKQTTIEIKEANVKIKGVYNNVEKKA